MKLEFFPLRNEIYPNDITQNVLQVYGCVDNVPNKNLDVTLVINVSETKCEAHRVWPICLLPFNFLIAMGPFKLIHKENLKTECNCVLNFYAGHNGLKKSRADNYGQIHQIEYMLLLLCMKEKPSKVWGD